MSVGLHSYDGFMDGFWNLITKHIIYNYIVKEVEKRIDEIGGFRLGFQLTMDIFVFNEVLWKDKGLTTVVHLWIFSFIEMNSSSSCLQCENKEADMVKTLITEDSTSPFQWMYLNLKKYIEWVQG